MGWKLFSMNLMCNKSVVKVCASKKIEGVMVISKSKSGLPGIQVENCVSISINKVISPAFFEVDEPLQLFVAMCLVEARRLHLLDLLHVCVSWEFGYDLGPGSLKRELETVESACDILNHGVLP